MMTLRKIEDSGSWRRKLMIVLLGGLSIEEAMDLVPVVPKYLKCALLSKYLLTILCHHFVLHSGDETATYT
jgi:hypothetical protein